MARLEAEMARLTGKECGMFVPTGTMGNLASIAAHCGRGDEIVLGDKQHIFKYVLTSSIFTLIDLQFIGYVDFFFLLKDYLSNNAQKVDYESFLLALTVSRV